MPRDVVCHSCPLPAPENKPGRSLHRPCIVLACPVDVRTEATVRLSLITKTSSVRATMNERLWSFSGGDHGQWRVTSVTAITGSTLVMASQRDVVNGGPSRPSVWRRQGVTRNERYVQQDVRQKLG